jgi:hypothetical protein
MVAVTMLLSHLAAPRQGYMEQAFHIFAYLDFHDGSRLVFDSQEMKVKNDKFKANNLTQFYPGAS